MACMIIGRKSRSSQGQGHSEVSFIETFRCYCAYTVSWIVMKLGRWVGLTMAFQIIARKSRSYQGQGHSEVNYSETFCCYRA